MKKILPILFLLISFSMYAQNTMYFMERVPQNNAYNPALIPDLKFHLGLPLLTGYTVNASNSGFNYGELNDFLDNLENENYNPDDFINSIEGKNKFLSEASLNILSFGFKLKEKGYFAFDLKANNILLSNADPEIAYLLADLDNIPSENFPISIDEMDIFENNTISMGFTYSRVINKNLTLGIRPVINFNTIGVKTSKINYRIERVVYTEQFEDFGEIYEYTSTEYDKTFSGEATVGMPVEINPDAIDGNKLDLDEGLFPENWEEDLSFGEMLKNASVAFDIGANYQLNKWMFSASLLNIGTSKWRNNAYKLNGEANYEDGNIYIKNEDEIEIGIPTKMYMGAVHQFSPKWNTGLVLNNTFYSIGSKTTATLSLNGHIGSMLSTSVSYTAGYNYDNVGLGLRLRVFPGTDFYFVTDNLIQLFNYEKAYRVSAAFGLNISIGAKDTSAENKEI